jgi:pseudouridine-5'-phosphate glycosidase/pseudouridine kinase
MDLTSASASHSPGTTTPGTIQLTPGGVARNIAEAAQNLLPAHEVLLVSPVGTQEGTQGEVDTLGYILKHALGAAGLRTDGLVPLQGATPACALLLAGGDLVGGVADMGLVETLDAATVRSTGGVLTDKFNRSTPASRSTARAPSHSTSTLPPQP